MSGSFWIGPRIVLAGRRLPEGVAGITALHERGASRPGRGETVVVGIEADSAALYQARLLNIFSARASTSARCSTIK